VDLMEKYEDARNAPNNLTFFTNNNGLTATADILEEVFTNPNFPKGKGLPTLDVSMKDSGKSRADLWAFAALVGLYKGIENNNKACDGKANAAVCGHREAFQDGCEVDFPRIPRFQTGRKDCIAAPNAEKPWHANHVEIQPRPVGNGPETAEFCKNQFGLNARQCIALIGGAHSFAKFNSAFSLLPYQWTRDQVPLFNNQVFKQLARHEQYFYGCNEDKTSLIQIGDEFGQPRNTSWKVQRRRFTENGGPFQWHHNYDRCIGSNTCAGINVNDPIAKGEPGQNNGFQDTTEQCCGNLGPVMQCQADCVNKWQNRERALSSDVGFYLKFQVHESGRPMGCGAFTQAWLDDKKQSSEEVDCPLEDHAPDGEPMWKIVEEMATSNENMMKDFLPAFEKMIENGYQDGDLNPQHLDMFFEA